MTDVADVRTIDRRTLLKASAWAAPAIAVTAVVPVAAATTTGQWDLSFEPPQAGSAAPMFTADLTGRYTVPDPFAYYIGNRGDADSPLGAIVVMLEIDRRLWRATGMTHRQYGVDTVAAHTEPVIDGNIARYTWTIVASVPANTVWNPEGGYPNAIFVRPDLEFLGYYPNDAVDPATVVPVRWTLLPPDGDDDASNNVVQYSAHSVVEAAETFGATTTAEWEAVDVGGLYRGFRPTSATLTALAINGIRAGDRVLVSVDDQTTAGVALDGDALLDGVQVVDLVTFDGRDATWQYQSYFRINQPIPAGSVLTLPFVHTDVVPPETPRAGQSSWVTYWPSTLNSEDQRARELAQASMAPESL